MKLIALLIVSFCLVAGGARAEDPATSGTTKQPDVTETGTGKVEKTEKTEVTTDKAEKTEKKSRKKRKEAKGDKIVKRPDGLVIDDVVVGTGKEAKLGSKITVHYRGTLSKNGQEFDSSYKRNEPITFELLEGHLIKGWTEGIPGMKVGGKRKLHIPSALGYGTQGTPGGPIGPNEDLDFEVELKDVN